VFVILPDRLEVFPTVTFPKPRLAGEAEICGPEEPPEFELPERPWHPARNNKRPKIVTS